jgi:hypothetical protein
MAGALRGREPDVGRQDRVPQEPRLHQVRLRDAELGVHGLQRAIVEQRDLDRRVEAELSREQLPDALGSGLVVRGALVPDHGAARAARRDQLAHRVEAGLR